MLRDSNFAECKWDQWVNRSLYLKQIYSGNDNTTNTVLSLSYHCHVNKTSKKPCQLTIIPFLFPSPFSRRTDISEFQAIVKSGTLRACIYAAKKIEEILANAPTDPRGCHLQSDIKLMEVYIFLQPPPPPTQSRNLFSSRNLISH